MKKHVEVCYSPALIENYDLTGKVVVVVDVLRATSCMVAGLASGVEKIIPVATVEEALEGQKHGFLTAGERNGEKIAGFQMGNSPFEFMEAICKGKTIVMTTTNGTQAIQRSRSAAQIFIGSFLNLTAVVEKVFQLPISGVVVHCAGWKNRFSMEDTLFAGAFLDKMGDRASVDCDAGLAALTLYRTVKHQLLDFVMKSSHAKRLEKLHQHLEKDIAFCLQTDVFDSVPMMSGAYLMNCP